MRTAGILATLALVSVMACSEKQASTNPFAPTPGGEASRTTTAASLPDTLTSMERARDAAVTLVGEAAGPTVGTVTDPTGDTTNVPGISEGFNADLASATVSGRGPSLGFTIRFARFSAANAVGVYLDTDDNEQTGSQAYAGLGTDAIVWMGVDFHGPAVPRSTFLDRAVVERWNSARMRFETAGRVPQTFVGDEVSPGAVEVTVSRQLLGNVTPHVRFRIEAFFVSPFNNRLNPNPTDTMPDPGLPPGQTLPG